MKLFTEWCSSRWVELMGVTLLLWELGGGVGLSLSWLVSTGDCGWNRRLQSLHMNIYNKWLWKTDKFSVQLQTPTHSLLKKKKQKRKEKKAAKATQQIYMKYNLLKYFCNQNSIGIHLEPRETKLLRSLQNVFSYYYESFPKPLQMCIFFMGAVWDTVPEIHVAVQTEPGSPDSLQPCGWSPRPAHGWRLAGPCRTPPKKEKQLWSNASVEEQYQLRFLVGKC